MLTAVDDYQRSRPDPQQADALLDEIEAHLRTRQEPAKEYIAMFKLDEKPNETFEDIIRTTREDARFLLEEIGKGEYMKVGNRFVLAPNEGGMGTGTSGPHLAEQILRVGGIARLSSVGGGRYHPDRESMQNNVEGVREIYRRLQQVVSQFQANTGVDDPKIIYRLLNFPHPELIERSLKKGEINKVLHFRLMDILTLAENLLHLKQVPNQHDRGMLGVNIMKKTEGYERSILAAAMAFSGDQKGDRSEGLLSLSAGVADDAVAILEAAKQKVPGLQVPRLDVVVSMGAPFKAIIGNYSPDLVTYENPDAGGHLGARTRMREKYEEERDGAAGEVAERKVSVTDATAPGAIQSLLSMMKEKNLNIPISLAGAYNLDTAEQQRMIRFIQAKSKELGFETPPDIGFQLGTPFSVAVGADPPPTFQFDQLSSNASGDNPAIIRRREQNRADFKRTAVQNHEAFEQIFSGTDNSEHQRILAGRIKQIRSALEQLEAGKNTIVFESTVGFDARAVPNKTLADIISGIQLREQECVQCLTDCSYAGRKEQKSAGAKRIINSGGDTPITDFKHNGQTIRVAKDGFCIEEVLQKEDPSTGVLVFRGDGRVAETPKSAINVIADHIRGLREKV